MAKKISNKIFDNITKNGAKTTLIGIILLAVSIYGLVFIPESPFDDEHEFIKVMYYTGAIGIFLCLVSDSFMAGLFEVLKKFLDNKTNKNNMILIAVLLIGVIACNVSKPLVINNTKDSIVYKERIRWDTLKIGADTAQIIIYSKDTLLVHDTIYSKKNGRATVVTQIKNGVMTSTAYCDSAERTVAILTTTIERYKQENTALGEQAKKSYWYWWLLGGFGLGVMSIILLKRL